MTFEINVSILELMKADFSKIIRESIKITKSNKRLWVFGLVLAGLGAGGGFGSGANFGDVFKETPKQEQENAQENKVEYTMPSDQTVPSLLNGNLISSNFPQVLGSTTTSLAGLVKTIPYSFYATLAILVLTSVVVFTAVSLYGRSWAQSGLIHGINKECVRESLSLYQMSDRGKLNAVEVIKIGVFPVLTFALLVIASILILLIPVILLGDAGKILVIFTGILWAIAVVIASVVLGASINLGVLAINLESLKWKEGLSRGFTVFKKFFMDVFIMSIINCFSGFVFGIATVIGLFVLGGIGVASVMGTIAFPPFMVAAGPIVFLALLALIMLMGLIGTISAVFTQSTWVLLYKQLTEENSGQ